MSGLVEFSQNQRRVLALIVVLAVVARIVGISFGLPYWLANDELTHIGGALRMIELRNPIPSLVSDQMAILYYPPGLAYVFLLLFLPWLAVDWLIQGLPGAQAYADYVLSDLSALILIARAVSAACGALTAYVVAKLAAEIFEDGTTGLVAGLLFAVDLHHVMLGHFARAWTPTVLLYWWGLLAAWRIYRRGREGDYVAAGLAAGLGFAVNYVGVLVSVAVAIAHLARHRKIVIDRPVLVHAAVVALFIIVFTALYWQNLFRLSQFSGFAPESAAQAAGLKSVLWRNTSLYSEITWRMAPVTTIVGLVGLLALARSRPWLVVATAVSFAPYIALILSGTAYDDRYMLPVTPVLMIAAAYLIGRIWMHHRALGIAMFVAVAVLPVAQTVMLDRLMLRPDTREVARDRILATRSITEGVVSAMRSVTFESDNASLELLRAIAPESLTYLQRSKLNGRDVLTGGGGPQIPALHVLQIEERRLAAMDAGELYDRLKRSGYSWYVTDDLFEDAKRKPFDPLAKERGSLVDTIAPGPDGTSGPNFNLTNQVERMGALDLFRIEHLGPVVRIYRLD